MEAEVKAKLKAVNGEEDEVVEQTLPTTLTPLQMKQAEVRKRQMSRVNRKSGLPAVSERDSEEEASEPSVVTA